MVNKAPACPRVDIGGQAVMEGVMMKAPDAIAITVRRPDGTMVVQRKEYTAAAKKHKWLGWPIIRGVVGFIDSMTFGYKCLMRSAEISGLEEIEAEMEKEKAEKKAAKKK